MFEDGEYEVFGTELLEPDCTLPPQANNSAANSSSTKTSATNNASIAGSGTAEGGPRACDN